MAKSFHVYILLCADETYYVGLTSDLQGRMESHQSGKYKRSFTARRLPIELKYFETFTTHQEAIEREKQIKKWSRAKKKSIINCQEADLKVHSKKSFQKK